MTILFKLLFDALLIFFFGIMFFQANKLPDMGNTPIEPAFFPRLVLLFGLLLMLCVLAKDIVAYLRDQKEQSRAINYKAVAYFVLLMAATTGYVVFSEALGFIAITTLFLFITVTGYNAMLVSDDTKMFGSLGSLLSSFVFSFAFSIVAYVVFSYVFKVTLP